MALPREAYRMLEAVLGAENISEDPAVLDSYTWQRGHEDLGPKEGKRFLPFKPEAVVLPGSTEEVQGIVKVCNKFKIRSKAHSTGWAAYAAVGCENGIQIDLRRMNRFEIDEKNMIAVVEPYVIGAQLLAELWKRGLNFNVIGAGPNCSTLAGVTSFMGSGYNNMSMGIHERNALGVEWVLPTGDILRLGSLGSGLGWFCGDGPGPSLRGLMRGLYGAAGGLGVFTKCAIKVYHWPGESRLPIRAIGKPPRYVWEEGAEMPENMALYHFEFDNAEQRDEALWAVGEAETGYAGGFHQRGILALLLCGYNADAVNMIEGKIPEILPRYAFTLQLVCNSKREFEYQKKVVDEVLAKTGGRIYRLEPELEAMMFLQLVQGSSNAVKVVFSRAGSFHPTMVGNIVTRYTLAKTEAIAVEAKQKYIEKGVIWDDMGEGGWGCITDYAHLAYLENETGYDPLDEDSVQGWLGAGNDTNRELIKQKLQVPIAAARHLAYPKSPHEFCSEHLGNYNIWQRKIKEVFDPNTASDPITYV